MRLVFTRTHRSISRIGVVLVLGVCLLATTRAQAGSPKLRMAPESFDFGTVPEGHKVHHEYWLANDGSDTLVVSKVKPMCGCTAVPLSTARIAPGDSVSLALSFNTARMKGTVNKLVRIYSNDSTQSPAKIYFTAKVANYPGVLGITPAIADLQQIDKKQEVIELKNLADSPYEVRIVSSPPHVECALSSEEILPGQTATLTLKTGKDTPIGPYESSVTLWFDGSGAFPLTIPIRGVAYYE